MTPKVEIFGRVDELARRFAEVLTGQVAYAVEHRANASVAFSRPTPEEVFHDAGELARFPRGRVQIFQVDERITKDEGDKLNWGLLERHLGALIEDSAYFKMPITETGGAKKYGAELEERLGSPPVIDFVHLGLGADGHTASLLPGDDRVLQIKDRWVAKTKPADGMLRLTLTYPVLNAARLVAFVVVGREKAGAVERVMRGDKTAPAARITNDNVLFLLDQGAAARL